MARRTRVGDAELMAAMERLWDSPEMQHIKGQLMVNHVEDYATVSWGLAGKTAARIVEDRIRRVRHG